MDQPWPLKIQSLSLASLRIASREREGTQLLTSSKGLGILSRCARLFLDSSASLGGPPSNEEVEGRSLGHAQWVVLIEQCVCVCVCVCVVFCAHCTKLPKPKLKLTFHWHKHADVSELTAHVIRFE